MMSDLKRGKIKRLRQSSMSDVVEIMFEDGKIVLIESGVGFRRLKYVLDAKDDGDLIGKRVMYKEDGLGVMVGFLPEILKEVGG